jgi:outer membrane protein assembly factor BamB
MKKLFGIMLIGLLVLAVSCGDIDVDNTGPESEIANQEPETPAEDEETETGNHEVTFNAPPGVLWELKINAFSNESFYADGYAYVMEYNWPPVGPGLREVKIRLSDGAVMWRTEIIASGISANNIVKHDGHIYFPSGNTINVFSDEDGRHEATVHVSVADGKEWKAAHYWQYSAISGPYMFWGNTLNPNDNLDWDDTGLVRFDTRKIDYAKSAEELQDIPVEVVWTKQGQFRPISSQMLAENGIVYFLTHTGSGNVRQGKGKCYLVALEAETGKVVWERILTHTVGLDHALAINGNYLHVVDWSPNCYNKHTGETVYETPWLDPYTEKEKIVLEASGSKGITVYDDKLYYCTGMFYADPYPRELTKNVVCIDAMSGEYIWGDMIPGQGSLLETVLLVSRGKAYIATDDGLRVYNAYTGKQLWYDASVCGSGTSVDYADENMFVYISGKTISTLTLTAIRTD